MSLPSTLSSSKLESWGLSHLPPLARHGLLNPHFKGFVNPNRGSYFQNSFLAPKTNHKEAVFSEPPPGYGLRTARLCKALPAKATQRLPFPRPPAWSQSPLCVHGQEHLPKGIFKENFKHPLEVP